MKLPHIRIAIAVLCAVLTAVIWSTVSVHRTLHRLLSRTDSVQTAAPNAAAEIDLLVADWQACSPRLRFLMQNDVLADLNEAIMRLQPECENDPDACAAELAGIAADLRWLDEKHMQFPV